MMNAASRHVFTMLDGRRGIDKARPFPDALLGKIQRVPRKPVALSPIPWGKPDPALARAVCQHLVDVMPPTVVAWRPSRETWTVRLLLSVCGWLLVGAIALAAFALFAHPDTTPPAVIGIPLN